MSWQPELDELRRREALAREMGGAERIARHRAGGKETVRERIEALLDPGTFTELGTLTGKAAYEGTRLLELRPTNYVAGTGRIDGRRVVVGGDDFTVRGGAADAAVHAKQVYTERLAHDLQMPMVRLVDGSGGGGSVKTQGDIGHTYIPEMPGWEVVVDSLSVIPVVAAALGSVAGYGAAKLVTSHFSLMVRETSQVFVAGPPVVKAGMGEEVDKEQLGGSQVHGRNGVVDNVADSEDDARVQIRTFLSYLPQNVFSLPPQVSSTDPVTRRDDELLSIVPREERRAYDMRRLVRLVVDEGTWFEIGRGWGKSVVTGLARLAGHPVGVIANDPQVYGGGLTSAASEKMARFADVCDTFHIPVVHVVDQPGFVIGTAAERAGTIRSGARALAAVFQVTTPWVALFVRRAYGVAGAAHGNSGGLNLRYAWPSADWGSLPLSGGIEAAYRRVLDAAADRDAKMAEIRAELDAVRSPLRTAEAFGIEHLIDPRDTRAVLCDWIETAYNLNSVAPGRKAHGFRP